MNYSKFSKRHFYALPSIILFTFLFTNLSLAQVLESEFFEIKIKKVTPNDKLWTDQGSGGDMPVAIWKVQPDPGYFTLGHFVTPFYDIDPNQSQKAPITITLKPKSGYENLLKTPEYERIWDDGGSGADKDCVIWKMKCPPNYVSLGNVISNSNEPPSGEACRCIKESATNSNGESVNLITRARYLDFKSEGETKSVPIFSDYGSGADKNCTIWTMAVNEKPSRQNQVYLVASTFKTNTHYNIEPPEAAYALVLDFPEKDILESVNMSQKRIKLKGPQKPTKEELKASDVVQEYSLPFFAVNDPYYDSQLAQFLGSPRYTVKRTTSYRSVDSFSPEQKDTKQYTLKTGSSNQSTFSNQVGITLGVEIEAEAGVLLASAKVTSKVETSYSRSWGGATTKYEEESFMYPQTVDGGCYGVLFQAKSTYQIYRQDGTPVGSKVDININEVYTDQWCPE